MAFGFGDAPLKKIGFAGGQPQAQAGLPLVIQQLYGGAQFTPGSDTMEGGFKTSPGFRP